MTVGPPSRTVARFCELARARLGRSLDLLAAGAVAHATAIHGELSYLTGEAAGLGHTEVLALAQQAEAAARQIPSAPAAVVACLRLVRSLGRAIAVLEAREALENRAHPSGTRPRPGARGRVLVVDDSKVSAHLLSALLSEKGFLVEIATNEPELEQALATFRPDLALSDVRMPSLDCAVVCRRVKEVAPLARVVLFSSLAEDALARECERARADGCVSRDRDLSAVVQRLVDETTGGR